MILHHIFEDLIEGFEPMRPPQPSKKTYFLKILKIFLKIGNFQKSRITLFLAGLKMYVKWRGGGFFGTPSVLILNGHNWSKK